MTALALYNTECDERRAMADEADAAWEADDLFGKALDTMSADELDDPACLEVAADDALFRASMLHGVALDALPTIDALIAAADVPGRLAALADRIAA